MSTALIAYYSSTGNTRLAASWLAEALRAKGFTVSVESILKLSPAKTVEADLLVLASPVYAWRPSAPMLDFMADLPALNGKPVFALLTCTGMPNNTLYEMREAVQAKGGSYLAGHVALGEESFPLLRFKRRIVLQGRPDECDRDSLKKFADTIKDFFERHIADPATVQGETYRFGYNALTLLAAVTTPDRLRKVMGKTWIDDKLCIRCGTCVQACPARCIIDGDPPRIEKGCIGCCACYNLCPTGALKTRFFGDPPHRRYRGPAMAGKSEA